MLLGNTLQQAGTLYAFKGDIGTTNVHCNLLHIRETLLSSKAHCMNESQQGDRIIYDLDPGHS